ncbi:MAG: mediator complex subunit [Sclerophora amabilis]|nr:MAG: mediator complex subunit [Sclerophora amabilis]
MGEEVSTWTKFFDRCLHGRVGAAKFESFAKSLKNDNPIRSGRLTEICLKPRSQAAVAVDPLLPIYAEKLLEANLITVPDILRTLLKNSSLHHSSAASQSREDGKDGEVHEWHNPTELEEIMLFRISRQFTTGQHPRNLQETRNTLKAVSGWMSIVVAASAREEMMQDMGGGMGSGQSESLIIRDALGMLVVALTENAKVASVLGDSCPKDLRQKLARSLSLYIPFLSQTSIQAANRLEMFQRQHQIFDNTSTKGMNNVLGGIDMEGMPVNGVDSLNVVDGPIINSRAGLYIYLNALGDSPTLTIDLVVASFDILAYAIYRKEPDPTLLLLRSFLVNKVPPILTVVSGSIYPPMTSEYCISQALNHVDPQAFPSLSSMFDPSSETTMFSDVRQDFLFACCLHDLIAEASIERLLGEVPMQTLPQGGRYQKDELVSQCTMDPDRVEGLLAELEGIDGNVGAVADAITEVIHNLCSAKETMTLKSICNSLARKPVSLDVLLLFNSSMSILQPICQLLNSWRYEEDQGEHQPVYEEFGSILLLVLAFVHRYSLHASDLGVFDEDSFIYRLIEKSDISKSSETLTEEGGKHLSGWIKGLFDSDNVISDDLMSSCRPQDFYLLVPTLFSQSVAACRANVIDWETLKGGLEYLLEIFLLPSLVGASLWLADHLWEAQGDAGIILRILQTIVRPESISGEAETMHNTILSIISSPLDHALRELRRLQPKRQDIEPILQSLSGHLGFKRTAASSRGELDGWTSTPGGGLSASIRNTIQSLVLWSTTPDINMTPANYTHRQILIGVRLLGARNVLRTLVDELKQQTQNGSGELALDIVTSIICAPTQADLSLAPGDSSLQADLADGPLSRPPSQLAKYKNHRLGLREALKLEVEDAPRLSTTDLSRAETTIRLHRRVESQLVVGMANVVSAADVMHDIDVAAATGAMGDGVGDIEINAAAAANIDDVLGEAAAAADFMGVGPGTDGMDLS